MTEPRRFCYTWSEEKKEILKRDAQFKRHVLYVLAKAERLRQIYEWGLFPYLSSVQDLELKYGSHAIKESNANY